MLIYQIVMTTGVVISIGDPWPGADGKPFAIKLQDGTSKKIPGIVFQILFVPDRVKNVEDSNGDPIVETTPSHYKIFMCSSDKHGGGLVNDRGVEETQAYTVYTSQVVMVGHVYQMREALEEIKELLEIQMENSFSEEEHDGGNNSQQQQLQPTRAQAPVES